MKSSKQCRRRWKNVLNATRKTGTDVLEPHTYVRCCCNNKDLVDMTPTVCNVAHQVTGQRTRTRYVVPLATC